MLYCVQYLPLFVVYYTINPWMNMRSMNELTVLNDFVNTVD